MRSLSASELLTVWEQGQAQSWVQRGLSLLAFAHPDRSWEQLAHLSIGDRDRSLLHLRESLFGTQMASVVTCPVCRDRLELNFSTTDIVLPPAIVTSDPITVTIEEYEVKFRLPTSFDLVNLTNQADVEVMQRRLLERCLVQIQYHDDTVTVEALSAAMMTAIAAAMAQADPQADVELALSCPACQHDWQASFDIVSFLWQELHRWAQGLLRDIHVMASAYGWSEAEILAMSGQRRSLYLEMIGQ
jgi:hypothetical protein